MTANGKIQITIQPGGIDSNWFGFRSDALGPRRVVVADAIIGAQEHSESSLFELRIIVPVAHAEEIVVGMLKGETELVINGISPLLEAN